MDTLVRYSREMKMSVKVQDFENYTFGGFSSRSHHDLGYTDDELAGLSDEERKRVNEEVKSLVLGDVMEQVRDEISHLQRKAISSSIVHDFLDPEREGAEEEHSRRRRRRS